MRHPLDRLSIDGFKSIKTLDDFELKKLNVLVGANGAGKSNLVSFFLMLRAMSEEGLAEFVTANGGADGFLFNGPKETPEMSANLRFGQNEYKFVLASTASAQLMVKSERTTYTPAHSSNTHSSGRLESGLRSWKGKTSDWGPYMAAEGHVYEAISSWMVYHFHDTSSKAAMRREHAVRDMRELNSDASNVAPFLFKMRQSNQNGYSKILETQVGRLVAFPVRAARSMTQSNAPLKGLALGNNLSVSPVPPANAAGS